MTATQSDYTGREATMATQRAAEEREGVVVVRTEEDCGNPPVPRRFFASPSSLHIRRCRSSFGYQSSSSSWIKVELGMSWMCC